MSRKRGIESLDEQKDEGRDGWRAGGSKRLLIALSIASAYSETVVA